MILLIDNYDSFTFNLYQYLGELGSDIQVVRNDDYDVEGILSLEPDYIVISPGPGYPKDAGVCVPLVERLAGDQTLRIPTLGICLGHQAICEALGGTIGHAKQLMHGKQSMVTLDTESVLFEDLPQQIEVARYHSLALEPDTLPECLMLTAHTDDDEVMAVEHKELPIYGVQFHPESIMTPQGKAILERFLD